MRSWSERLPLILAIVEKDIRVSKWWWVAASIVAFVGLMFTFPIAMSVSRLNLTYGGGFVWYDSSLRGLYGLTALLTSVALGLAFSHVHSGEVRRGTIRSIILYPVDMNDVTLAKLASSLILGFFLSGIIFVGFMLPMFTFGVFPVLDFLAIFVMTVLMGFLALATGVFLSQVLAHVSRRLVVSASTMGSLFLLLAVLLTETVVGTIGTYLLSIIRSPGYVTPAEAAPIYEFARAISVLSPQHMGARILSDLFGIGFLWPDIHVVIPGAIVVLIGGYILGRKLYLDLFIR